MNIPSKYDPSKTEEKWYSYWMEQEFFDSKPDSREPYTIVIPPPNVTGVLHMGHMLNNTIQDILVRRARMQGKNACWVPGTDHASIATEARVVAKLKEEGIDKATLSREEFLKHAWEWKEKHGGIILEQLKKLGASCDWKRTKFTMDDNMSESVIKVFIDLFNKGLIYRGIRMVNWDPQAQTAVSDEEVIFKELQSKLYYVKYKIESEDSFVTIATTRPETILGDTAVCINPKDERYKNLKGKKVIVPMVDRVVPIIEDEYVDMEFGTGCLKITPAHDINDYEIGIKHNLESIDIFKDDGTLSEKAGLFVGIERFEARKLAEKKLEENGSLVKIEDYMNKVGFSERTDAVIEPKLSMQWFLNMKDLSKPALDNVMNDTIALHPSKFKNTYKHWMENVKDWCISRQLWWGQRIPAYYLPNGEFIIANSIDEALKLAIEKTNDSSLKAKDLRQDEDVLDTWFSSWLWPISVFDGIRNPDNEELKYYYPTNDLVTAPEILFFWVARMIISGYEYQGDKPFENVYLTGIVRDKQRRKMSKSLGNSPDPIELMKKYSADGVRIGMLLCSPAGNDLLFDESLTEQGRNFANKIWNAFRLVKSWEVDGSIAQPEVTIKAANWFNEKLNDAQIQIDKQLSEYRISEAVMTLYKLFWDDFSSWYLEAIKPAYQKAIDKKTLDTCIEFFEKLLQILHPFMPFITEEIWHYIKERDEKDCIMVSRVLVPKDFNKEIIADFEIAQEIISTVRTIRKEKQLPNKELVELFYSSKGSYKPPFQEVIKKLAFISEINEIVEKPEAAASFIIKTNEFYVPLSDKIDVEKEIEKLQKDLDYNKEFLQLIEKKLSNQKFVQNAPEKVVEIERKKEADAKTKIKVLEEQIAGFK